MSGRNVDLELMLDRRGVACGARADILVEAPREAVWEAMRRLDEYGKRIAMVETIERRGDEVIMNLRFRVAFLSKRFSVRSRLEERAPDSLHFHYLSGEPRSSDLRLQLAAEGERRCRLGVHCAFDLDSLGWVVTYFLRHHPEIRAGVFAGAAFSIASALREMSER